MLSKALIVAFTLAPLSAGNPAMAPAEANREQTIHLSIEGATFFTGDGTTEVKALGPAWAKKFLPYCEATLTFTGTFALDVIQKGQIGFTLVRGSERLEIDRAKVESKEEALWVHPEMAGNPWRAADVKPPFRVAYSVQLPADGVKRDDWEGWSLQVDLQNGENILTTATVKLNPEVYPAKKRPPLKWD